MVSWPAMGHMLELAPRFRHSYNCSQVLLQPSVLNKGI